MKRKKCYRVLIVVAGVIFFVTSFVLLSYLMRPVTNSRKNICGFYAEPENSLDVVYVGGSACYTFWEPMYAWNEYGFTSYNFATDALQAQSIQYILKEIQKTQSPKLYIVDLRPFQYGNSINQDDQIRNIERVSPFRNVADNMKYSYNRIELIEAGAPKQEEEWTYWFDIAKYHSNLLSLVKKENWQYIFNENNLYSKGFDCYAISNEVYFSEVKDVEGEIALGEEIDDMFIDLLEYCKQEELPVLFIVHAYCINDYEKQKFNYMERRIEEFNQDFLDVNDYFYDIGFDITTDFHDINHVNLLGADKYSIFLAEYLDTHYDLPDKRNDLQYEQWNIDYIQWWEEMELIREGMQN